MPRRPAQIVSERGGNAFPIAMLRSGHDAASNDVAFADDRSGQIAIGHRNRFGTIGPPMEKPLDTVTPLAARMAALADLDVEEIPRSAEGRVTKAEVEQLLRQRRRPEAGRDPQ